jgi:hypothetical protein
MVKEPAFIHIKPGQYVFDQTAGLEDVCNLSRTNRSTDGSSLTRYLMVQLNLNKGNIKV